MAGTRRAADWGVCLEVEGEELDAVWHEDDLRASIDEYLAQYAAVEKIFSRSGPNHKGLESAKPDLQSLFKKPGRSTAGLSVG